MMDLSGVSSAPAPSQQQAAAQQQQVNQQVQQQHPLTGPIPGLSASLPGRNYISSLSKSNQDGTSFSIQDDQDFPALGNYSLDLIFAGLSTYNVGFQPRGPTLRRKVESGQLLCGNQCPHTLIFYFPIKSGFP